MLKRVLKSTLLFVALIASSLQTFAQNNRSVADQVAAVVGSSVILWSDVESAAKSITAQRQSEGYTSGRDVNHEALETLLMQKLLYSQALIDSVPINFTAIEMGVESMITQEIANRGSIQALEEFYRKPVFEIRDDIRTRYTEMQYAQAMRQTIEDEVVVTPGEVELFYNTIDKSELPIIPEQYVYAQVTKYPPSAEDAKFRARQSLVEMRERIMSGTRFDALARMYSVDGSAIRGGEMDPTSKDGFVKPFSEALVRLAEGQVSGVVETEYGFHLIEMLEILPNDVYRCRHILLRPIFTDEEISEATQTLDSLRVEILNENLTFEDAAARYSEDKYSKLNGGVVTNFDLLELYNAFDAKLATTRFLREELGRDSYLQISRLQPGEISRPFASEDRRGNVLVNMIKLIEIVPSHPASLDHDYIRVEELALQAKQEKIFNEFVAKKVEGMYVRVDDRFKGYEFENDFWLK